MFDIGFSELLLILVIGLLVLGPTRLPLAIRTVMSWVKAIRGLAENVQNELSHELKLQELKESIKKTGEAVDIQNFSPELSKTVNELKESAEQLKNGFDTEIQEHQTDLNDLLNNDSEVKKDQLSSEGANVSEVENNQIDNKNKEEQPLERENDVISEITLNPDYYPSDDEFADMDIYNTTTEINNLPKDSMDETKLEQIHAVKDDISVKSDSITKEKELSK